ncbi:MAG TPA: hypothetical protein VMM78_17595 [Thermomicrobiales bacterium]|nr:hypothetical protein [Thermomicrobiales bacterium]
MSESGHSSVPTRPASRVPRPDPASSHSALWSGRFAVPMDRLTWKLNASLRMWDVPGGSAPGRVRDACFAAPCEIEQVRARAEAWLSAVSALEELVAIDA